MLSLCSASSHLNLLWSWTSSFHSDTRGRKHEQSESSNQPQAVWLFRHDVGLDTAVFFYLPALLLHLLFKLKGWRTKWFVSAGNQTSQRRESRRSCRQAPTWSWPLAASTTCASSTLWMSGRWQCAGFWRGILNASPRLQEVGHSLQ